MEFNLPTDLGIYVRWVAIATAVSFALMVLAFILGWGIRFRLFGVTSFMVVLTVGIFGLSLGLFSRTLVPGSVRYTLVYDNSNSMAVIALPPQVTIDEVKATLTQAANDLYAYGRIGGPDDRFTVKARTITHPQEGISKPVYLGQVRRSLVNRKDDPLEIEIFAQNFSELPKPSS